MRVGVRQQPVNVPYASHLSSVCHTSLDTTASGRCTCYRLQVAWRNKSTADLKKYLGSDTNNRKKFADGRAKYLVEKDALAESGKVRLTKGAIPPLVLNENVSIEEKQEMRASENVGVFWPTHRYKDEITDKKKPDLPKKPWSVNRGGKKVNGFLIDDAHGCPVPTDCKCAQGEVVDKVGAREWGGGEGGAPTPPPPQRHRTCLVPPPSTTTHRPQTK